jgi:twitching motility protein PilT
VDVKPRRSRRRGSRHNRARAGPASRSARSLAGIPIASKIPTLAELNLPASLAGAAALENGIVLVTGPTGSGKSSTLAAIINLINETRAEYILTIEDPIEFLHQHKKGTVNWTACSTSTERSRSCCGRA